ncbi:hypothetical protein [Cryobacterium sp. BB736]|uniref:hypothetical protein n=1 Tax=Cryobacterium sp. BB736 TaxID=2746963 RepID=UPI0018735D70|nr:hypothetical protein [Cryobacterium sp. BB736]
MMVEVIDFPDAEEVAKEFLRAEYTARSVDSPNAVGTKLPKNHTTDDLFTRVSRVGGESRDLVTDSPRLLVECFGPSTVAASDRAKITRALMLASARLTKKVTRATEGGGVAFLPDPDTNQPRYQFVVQLDLRGVAI